MWSRSTSRPFHSCAIQDDHSSPSGTTTTTTTATTTTSDLILIIWSGSHQPRITRTTPSSSSQRINSDCQQEASSYIIVIVWGKKRAVNLLQQQMCWICVDCNELLLSLMCMSLQCTLCKRGRPKNRFIPVQLWALTHCLFACVMFVLLFLFCSICLCLFFQHFVCIFYHSVCVWMQSFAGCSIHFDVDIHVIICSLSFLRAWMSIFIFCVHACQGYVLVSHKYELSTFFVGYIWVFYNCEIWIWIHSSAIFYEWLWWFYSKCNYYYSFIMDDFDFTMNRLSYRESRLKCESRSLRVKVPN